ncbi:hypothetical protein [Mycolicibacterium porcinum]|uniref:Uncharacterized protein n=1 Tax=Mycolicibacterium porcinum TaxID=39693 RepID=A0ABV3VPX6_9MYCO
MTDTPRESRPLDAQMIPVEHVKPGYSLAVEEGGQRLLFQVEKTGFSSVRGDDGTLVNKIILTSGEVAGGGDPWVLEYPAGTPVCRILGVSAT